MARSHSTQECFQGLREACGDAALSYRTVARLIKEFREGRDAVEYNPTWRTTQFNTLFPCGMRIADGLCVRQHRKSVKNCDPHSARHSGFRKIAARWIPHEISECNNGTAMQFHRPCWTGIKGKVMAFLGE